MDLVYHIEAIDDEVVLQIGEGTDEEMTDPDPVTMHLDLDEAERMIALLCKAVNEARGHVHADHD